MSDPRSALPSVDKVLSSLRQRPGVERFSHERIVEAVRCVLREVRESIACDSFPSLEEIVSYSNERLESEYKRGIRRVVNGTGVVLHTGLGRAVLPKEAIEAVAAMDGCCSLQVDLESGERGRRDGVIEDLLRTLTGAESATVVNNNAAGTLIVLAALSAGREVIVSRGQLIEIGGSFRLPDVITQSGARMVEVGTTNKTHLKDYAAAITPNTSVLLSVNPSNYRIVGFTKQVSVDELASLKVNNPELIVVDDLGCGALIDLSRFGLPHEPTVQESLSAGADVALFSGDKLIGGPQSGIIVGRKCYIDRIRKHPLARALRVGKCTIASLEATLKLFLNPDTLFEKNPTLRMLTTPLNVLEERAEGLAQRLSSWVTPSPQKDSSVCGGGSMPDTPLETMVVAIRHDSLSADDLARRLRVGDPCVMTRVQNDQVLIDTRTLLDGDEDRILSAVKRVMEDLRSCSRK